MFFLWQPKKKYDRYIKDCDGKKVIISSNIKGDQKDFVIDYNGVIDHSLKYFDNSTVMLMNTLLKAGIERYLIAGVGWI